MCLLTLDSLNEATLLHFLKERVQLRVTNLVDDIVVRSGLSHHGVHRLSQLDRSATFVASLLQMLEHLLLNEVHLYNYCRALLIDIAVEVVAHVALLIHGNFNTLLFQQHVDSFEYHRLLVRELLRRVLLTVTVQMLKDFFIRDFSTSCGAFSSFRTSASLLEETQNLMRKDLCLVVLL